MKNDPLVAHFREMLGNYAVTLISYAQDPTKVNGEMESMLERVSQQMANAVRNGRPPDVQVLGAPLSNSQLANEILKRGCHALGSNVDVVTGPGRTKPVVEIRHCLIAAIFERTRLNKNEIAHVFHRDHATVISALKAFEQRKGGAYRRSVAIINRALEGLV